MKTKIKIKFNENMRLALICLGLALIIWLFAKSGELREARLIVPVVATNVHPRMEIELTPPSVPAIVRYGRDASSYINSDNFAFEIDVTELRENIGVSWITKTISISEENWVSKSPLVQTELVKVDPQKSTVRARMRWNAVPATVQATIVNADRLPEGFQLVTPVKVTPREVFLIGDEDVLAAMGRDAQTSRVTIRTENINVASRTQGALETVELVLPPGIQMVEQPTKLAEINLEIQEVQTVREIRGIPVDFHAVAPDSVKMVYDVKSAAVNVFGPQSLVRQVTAESFRLSLVRPPEELPGTTRDLAIEAHFNSSVPDEIRSKVTIRSIDPPTLSVTYEARAPAAPANPQSATAE